MSTYRIRLAAPDLGPQERAAVARVLDSDVLSRGPELAAFEAEFARWTGVGHAVGLSSGTAAVHLALAACDVGPGRRVLAPSFTVPGSINPALSLGADLVWLDINARSRALDPEAVRAVVREGDVVLLVHAFGQAAPAEAMHRICANAGAVLIEDACEALGTAIGGRHAGSLGHAGAFGFYPNKQITTGEGGMLITDDAQLAARVRLARNHGRSMDGSWLDQLAVGHNYRMSELSAALGRAQLARLPELLAKRRAIAAQYQAQLGECEGLRLPADAAASDVGLFAYVLELAPPFNARRDALVADFAELGIQLGRYFAPMHLQPGLRGLGLPRGALPVTEAVAAAAVALPLHPGLSAADVEEVTSCLRRWLTA